MTAAAFLTNCTPVNFLGMCVIYGCHTRISSTWGKPHLNSSFQFIASFELHSESQGISPPSNGHHGSTLQILTQPLGRLICFHISLPVYAGASLLPQKAADQDLCSYFLWSIPPKLLCLTFMNPSMITNTLLLAELDQFSSSWQHSRSSSSSRASRSEQLGQYLAVCVEENWVINKCGLVAVCVWFIHGWVMVKPACGFSVNIDFSAFEELELKTSVSSLKKKQKKTGKSWHSYSITVNSTFSTQKPTKLCCRQVLFLFIYFFYECTFQEQVLNFKSVIFQDSQCVF